MANLDKITILIKKESNFELILLSFPTRERGLKFLGWNKDNVELYSVVPHAGTWIEIPVSSNSIPAALVSFPTRERGLKYPEISAKYSHPSSFPTRERGLKSIESSIKGVADKSRSPRGNVD